MTELAIITPTRGRPMRAREMRDAVLRTAAGSVAVWFGVDLDDLQSDALGGSDSGDVHVVRGARRPLSAWTNDLARMALYAPDPPRYFASLGDDHRPLTPRWDRKLIEAIEALGGSGFAYGNDLFQGEVMPTAWVVSADIVRELGWMMLPACAHMYVDAAVLELGRAAGRIAYCPDVIIEHVHPLAGKTVWDASYRESNAEARYEQDRLAFEAWRDSPQGLRTDAGTVVMAADTARLRAEGVR